MFEFFVRATGSLGAAAGIAGSLATATGLPLLLTIALWALMIWSVLIVIVDFILVISRRPRRFRPQSDAISKYMQQWLGSGGLAVVFSRDMSWVKPDTATEQVLMDKARRHELILFVAKTTDLIRKFRAAGAIVHQYPNGFAPNSRFTVVDYGKSGARVAVGLHESGKHTIREFSLGASGTKLEPIIADLIRLAELAVKKVEDA